MKRSRPIALFVVKAFHPIKMFNSGLIGLKCRETMPASTITIYSIYESSQTFLDMACPG